MLGGCSSAKSLLFHLTGTCEYKNDLSSKTLYYFWWFPCREVHQSGLLVADLSKQVRIATFSGNIYLLAIMVVPHRLLCLAHQLDDRRDRQNQTKVSVISALHCSQIYSASPCQREHVSSTGNRLLPAVFLLLVTQA